MPHHNPHAPLARWAPSAPQADAEVIPWLFDGSSLTHKLTQVAAHRFNVTPLHEGWQVLRDDECDALGLVHGSEGWVREVYLRGRGQAWVFARSVAGRQALENDNFAMAALGTRSLGELLFSDQAFQRQPFQVCQYPRRWLPEEVRGDGLWARRSRFDRGQLSLLVMEVFLPALWQALHWPADENT